MLFSADRIAKNRLMFSKRQIMQQGVAAFCQASCMNRQTRRLVQRLCKELGLHDSVRKVVACITICRAAGQEADKLCAAS
jgi:hypothetical protein